MLYCMLNEKMKEEADCDKACSESIAEDESVKDEDETDRLGKELEAHGSVTAKRKRAGRKSCWAEEFVEEVVNVVCEVNYSLLSTRIILPEKANNHTRQRNKKS